jgi:hypothetical protein
MQDLNVAQANLSLVAEPGAESSLSVLSMRSWLLRPLLGAASFTRSIGLPGRLKPNCAMNDRLLRSP